MATDTSLPTVIDGEKYRARHTRTQVLGLLLLAGFAVVFSVALAISEPAELAFALPILTVVLLGAFLSWRFGTWAKVVGVLVALALGGMMSGFAIYHSRYVSSFLDFVPSVLLVLGAGLAAGGGIAAIVRRRHREAFATPLERRIRQVALGIVATAVVVSGGLHLTSLNRVAEAEAAGAVEATMSDFEFAEGIYEVASGGTIHVRNRDMFYHDFTVPELGISERVVPGGEALITIDAAPGTFQLICTPHARQGDDGVYEGMVAELIVH